MKIKERKKLILTLVNAAHVRPEKSLDACLCLHLNSVNPACGYLWEVLPYSKKNDAFNSSDLLDNADAQISVDFWAELPDFEQ